MNESGARMTDWAFISTSSLLIILSVEVRNPKESGNNRWESVQDGFQQQQHTKIVHVRLYVAVLLEVFQKKSCLFKCPDLPPSSCYSQACQSFSPLKQDAWVVLLSSALTQENPCTSKAIRMLQARKESCAAKSIDHCEPWDIGFSVTSQNMRDSIVGTCLHWQMSAWTVWCDEYQLKKRHVLLLPVPALQSTSVVISVLN